MLKQISQFLCRHDDRKRCENKKVFVECWKCDRKTEGLELPGMPNAHVGVITGNTVTGHELTAR